MSCAAKSVSVRIRLRVMLWSLVMGSGCAAAGRADEPAAKAGDDAREVIVRAAAEYELFLGPDRRKLEMQKEPVLRWPNPTRETPEGATFVWTRDGRPE